MPLPSPPSPSKIYILVSLSIKLKPPIKSSFLSFLSSSESSLVLKYLAFERFNPFKLTFSKESSIYLTASDALYGIMITNLSKMASFSFHAISVKLISAFDSSDLMVFIFSSSISSLAEVSPSFSVYSPPDKADYYLLYIINSCS